MPGKKTRGTEANAYRTKSLLKILKERPHAARTLVFDERAAFLRLLRGAMAKAEVNAPELARRTGLSESFVYQLQNGSRTPGRDAVLRVAFALGMALEDAQRLLARAGKAALYPKNRRDAALIACIEQGGGLSEADATLRAMGEAPLLDEK